jgi:hypothetical protein
MKRLLILAVLLGFMVNCAEVMIEAPNKQNVRLLSEAKTPSFSTEMKCLYLFWGLIPITSNTTSDLIAKYDLKSVKARTHYGIIDWLISTLTGGILTSWSVEIEGEVSE